MSNPRILALYHPTRIMISQLYPYVCAQHLPGWNRTDNFEFRTMPLDPERPPQPNRLPDCDVLLVQLNYVPKLETDGSMLAALRERYPQARIVVLDPTAPTNLPLAKVAEPLIDAYVKKAVLRNTSTYSQPTRGDTTLADYYNRMFGIEEPLRSDDIPPEFLKKLIIGPSFFTDPSLLFRFIGESRFRSHQPIDLHARIATQGTGWYQAMRRSGEEACRKLDDLDSRFGTGLSLRQFLRELSRSKLCFSPFGYGEQCWRDFEAISAGAIVLKQDMRDVLMEPNVFVEGAYAPLNWDFGNLGEVVRTLLADSEQRESIRSRVFNIVRDFVVGGGLARHVRTVTSGS